MNRDVRAALLASAATLMTMLVLSPLLVDRVWLQPVALVVAAVGLAGAAVAAAELPRWTSPPVSAAAGLVIATALLVPGQATLGGFLPTPTSVEALGILLRSGLATTRVVEPPAPTDDPGVIALLTLAAGAVALLTLVVAGPLRRPGAAGLPLLLVVCVAAALAPDGVGLGGYLAAAIGYLGLTLTDADQRVRTWGAVLARRTRSGRPAPSGVTEHLVTAAATTAVVALTAGALLPLLAPGGGGSRLERIADRFGGGGGPAATTVNPFLDIRQDLEAQDDTVLLRYATTDPDPDPLRIVTADSFDGAVWVPSPTDPPPEQDVAGGLPAPPGASAQVLADAEQYSTAVGVGPLAETYLPMPYPASTVDVEGTWLYDARTLNVVATDDTTQGLSYTVGHYGIEPDAATLASVPATSALDPLWTQLPPDMSQTVVDEARRVVEVAGAGTRYEQGLALQQWFRNSGGFTYSLDAPDVTDRDAVEAFLEDRQGYCVQFASTMALMARSLDIPARVAVGFLPGEEVEPGQWAIRANNAHAWPELYFEGVGWVRFEPTPATRTGAPPAWALPESDPALPGVPVPSEGATPPQDLAPEPVGPQSAGSGAEGTAWDRAADVLGQVGVAVGGLAVLAGLLSLPRLWRWWRSRRRASRAAGDDAASAAVAWTELLERLADRHALPRGSTVREQAADLRRREPLGDEASQALSRLAEACERAMFAVEPAPSTTLDDDVRTVVGAVTATRDRWPRLTATWFPSPTPDVSAEASGTTSGPVGERVGR